MLTSALSLNQILTVAFQHRPETDKFLDVIVEHLELSGLDAKSEAIRLVNLLVVQLKTDIEKLPHDEKHKAIARAQANVFNGLLNYSHFHLDLKNAKSNFLKSENLVNLSSLHMSLAGFTKYEDLDTETKELSKDFRSIRDDIHSSNLPENVKATLIHRVTQMISILENYYFFGEHELENLLEALVGQLVLFSRASDEKDFKLFKRIYGSVGKTFSGLAKINSNFKTIEGLKENAMKALDAFNSL